MKKVISRYPNDLHDWWNQVQDDVKWAENNLQNGFYPQTCFVTQQIAEKALKTFLLYKNQIIEKIHKLPVLLKQCAILDKKFELFLDHAKDLDRYYITTRYPPGFGGAEGEFTKEEAEKSLELARDIVEFVRKKIKM